MYRIHPAVPPAFTRSTARTAAPPAVGGNVKVASFNVLNYFTTFTNGSNAAGQTGQVCTQGTDTALGHPCAAVPTTRPNSCVNAPRSSRP